MKLTINISIEKELDYSSGTGSPKKLNPKDEGKQGQNFNMNVIGFNGNESIQSLVDVINEWVKKNNE